MPVRAWNTEPALLQGLLPAKVDKKLRAFRSSIGYVFRAFQALTDVLPDVYRRLVTTSRGLGLLGRYTGVVSKGSSARLRDNCA